MNTPAPTDPLDAVPLLRLLPPALRAAMTDRRVAAGEVLFRAGERPVSMFALASGEAWLTRGDAQGREVVLQRARGGFLAEASLTAPVYHCDARAATPVHVVALPRAALRDAIDTDAAVRWAWIDMLAASARAQRAQAERLALKTVAARLAHRLAELGTPGVLAVPGPRVALAAELGVTHEALYRCIARLKREGLLVEPRDDRH